MITNKIAPVAIVLHNNVIASFPLDNFSPIIPEPTIVATRKNEPINSTINDLVNFLTIVFVVFYRLK